MSHFSTLGGMCYVLSGKAKIKRKEQANNPKQDFSFTEYQRSGRLLFPLVFIWVFGPEFSRLYLESSYL